jgi:hypothetical protein
MKQVEAHRGSGAHCILWGHGLLPSVSDQTGYWAIRIVTGVPDALPLVGPLLVTLLRGGASVGQGTLSRFYTVHTLVLPLLATAALAGAVLTDPRAGDGPILFKSRSKWVWFASSPSNETLAGGDPNKVVGIMIWMTTRCCELE